MMNPLISPYKVNSSGTALPSDEISGLGATSWLGRIPRNPLSSLSYHQSAQVVDARFVYIYKTDFDSQTSYYQIEASLEDNPAYQAMLATEHVLRATWDTPEEDEAWAHL